MTAVIVLFLFLVLLAASLHVAVALGFSSLILAELFSDLPIMRAAGEVAWSTSSGFLLVTIPLYVLLGQILLRSGAADRMYGAITHWISWLPGGLMHSNIGTSAMFAATCGSSVATAATIGTVALPQMDKYKYDRPLFLGSIVAGGTLGILIPPSVVLILYGVLTNTSIPRLYAAGIVPGLLLAALFSIIIAVITMFRRRGNLQPVPAVSWRERVLSLVDLVPPVFIFLVVVGTIYTGFATATESAALGVVAALIVAMAKGTLNVKMLMESFDGTVRITSTLILIIVCAYIFNMVLNFIGIVHQINSLIRELDINKYELILAVIVIFILLGCVMEAMAMVIAVVPMTASVVVAAGFDPVWFGILVVILVEMALITPPVGMNLFVVRGLRHDIKFSEVVWGSVPFVVAMIIMMALLLIFPGIALYLPSVTMG